MRPEPDAEDNRACSSALDCTPAVVAEAVQRGCNVVVCASSGYFSTAQASHWGQGSLVEQTIMAALQGRTWLFMPPTPTSTICASGVNAKLAREAGTGPKPAFWCLKPAHSARLTTYVPQRALDQSAAGHSWAGCWPRCMRQARARWATIKTVIFRWQGTGGYHAWAGRTTPTIGRPVNQAELP